MARSQPILLQKTLVWISGQKTKQKDTKGGEGWQGCEGDKREYRGWEQPERLRYMYEIVN